MLKSKEKLNVKAICAAPFLNPRSKSAKDGMEKSYDEILKLLSFMGEKVEVYKGAEQYLADEKTPVTSDAAKALAELCENYSSENPLYVVAIGAITNVASALLLNPEMKNKVVIVWLGGHAHHFQDTIEFNMHQDIAAARVVMQSGAPFVQLPCAGVVDSFTISKPELEYWLMGKNELANYLATTTIEEAEAYASNMPWTRVIWDVTAVAWLLNDGDRFMESKIIPTKIPDYERYYVSDYEGCPMTYVYHIKRDALMKDLIEKLTKAATEE
jgi:inosine-uridine nucleoside N-ribohydrolase